MRQANSRMAIGTTALSGIPARVSPLTIVGPWAIFMDAVALRATVMIPVKILLAHSFNLGFIAVPLFGGTAEMRSNASVLPLPTRPESHAICDNAPGALVRHTCNIS